MNTDHLKKLAIDATPGPWREVTTLENGFFEVIGDSKRVAHAFGNCRQEAIDNRRYIAAANPAVVLELIRQRDELLAALKKCRFALEPYDDIKPRDWKTDRANLMLAHQSACAAIAKAEG